MTTLVNVGRYHLVDRLQYGVLPVGVLALVFAFNATVGVLVPDTGQNYYTGGLLALYVFLAVHGAVSMSRALPFAFALGLSRRTYFLGTLGLGIVVAAVYSLGVAVLQVAEAGTAGWGLRMYFFRVPWLLDGPWPQTWLTAFTVMVLLFAYGVWWGLVYRRWGLPGSVLYLAVQLIAIVVLAAVVSWLGAWSTAGRFVAELSPLGLTGIMALLAVVVGAGGYATIRRLAV